VHLAVRGLPGNTVRWSSLLYHCDNVRLAYKLAKLDTATPNDMRAIGVFAIETAMDELAHAAKVRDHHRGE
jgi:xanthine dehydrogenase YagR molybdenum-binding subunit